jgi:hypothetical protein
MATLKKITKDNFSSIGQEPYPIYAKQFNEVVDQINTNTVAITAIGSSDVGADPTPVVRTNNPIVGTDPANTNIDALDAAIGVTPTITTRTVGPLVAANSVNLNLNALNTAVGTDAQLSAVSRTTGPVAVANSVAQNLDALDAAIGADHTPVTRTVGQTAVANSVNANIDALDAVIGFDTQFTSANVGTKNNSIYQNMDAFDVFLGNYQFNGSSASINAAGTIITDATDITTGVAVVALANGAKGVQLPAVASGKVVYIYNTVAAQDLKIWPSGVTEALNAAADAASIKFSHATDTSVVVCTYQAANKWTVTAIHGTIS